MPEAPEARAAARYLTSRLGGDVLQRCRVLSLAALKTYQPSPDDLVGRELLAVTTRGKYLQFDFGGRWLVLHLSRGGWIKELVRPPKAIPKPGRGPLALRLEWASGAVIDVTEAGTEKRLAAWITDDLSQISQLADLGPEVTSDSLTLDVFVERLKSDGRSPIKNVLRDQHVIAGIGNAWSDEILHRAKLSPFQPASAMTDSAYAALFDAINATISEACAALGGLALEDMKDSKRQKMRVHARAGQVCGVCGDTIRSVSYATRSFEYCPTCQTGGKPLADRRLSRLLK
jgi:formamidopyrimidine-DNA glycosylase